MMTTHKISNTLSNCPAVRGGGVVARRVVPLTMHSFVARSSDSDKGEPMLGNSLTSEEAAAILGVTTTASFDEIMLKKNELLQQAGSDQDKQMEVEGAYDALFSSALRRRITGEAKVSATVRYADVPATPRRGPSQRSGSASSKTLLTLPSGPSISVAQPRQDQALQQSAVYGTLAVWSIIQAVLEAPSSQLGDTAGLQMSLALAYTVYTLKESKKMSLGKAIGISLGGLIVGALVGTAVHSLIRVDIVPLGSFQSPGVFCTEFVIVSLLLSSLFLV